MLVDDGNGQGVPLVDLQVELERDTARSQVGTLRTNTMLKAKHQKSQLT